MWLGRTYDILVHELARLEKAAHGTGTGAHDSSSGKAKKKNEQIKQSVHRLHTKGAILRGPYMLFNGKVCLVEPMRAL